MSTSPPCRVGLICAVSLAACLGTATPGVAQPTMTVMGTSTVADYDHNHPGNERLFTYNVRNVSDPGDINNMIWFTLPAGTDQGVYRVLVSNGMTGWARTVGADEVFLDGTGIALPPGSDAVIKLYSTLLHVGQGEATAVAGGIGTPIPFNTVLVPVPAYHRLDRDQDADIDADDFATFEACASGPAMPFAGDCVWADLDGDEDVDQSDFGVFQRCLTGDGGGYIEGCEAE